jgi:PhzF family phenazine biosynthesis protein
MTPILQIDAFSSGPFTGNPAAVCMLDGPADAVWMQKVASQIGLSETAFAQPRGDGFGLRWFTPSAEVDLCGHATLACAFALWHTGRIGRQAPAVFHTRSGALTCRRSGDEIAMDFPATPAAPAEAPVGLLDALGVTAPQRVGKNKMDYTVVVPDELTVRSLRPDLSRLAAVDARGVMVTARSGDAKYDFVSRFFAPRVGVDEDPVTGSAHCALGPYWAGVLGRRELRGYQASRRGGVVGVRVLGDRVTLIGKAMLVWQGELLV